MAVSEAPPWLNALKAAAERGLLPKHHTLYIYGAECRGVDCNEFVLEAIARGLMGGTVTLRAIFDLYFEGTPQEVPKGYGRAGKPRAKKGVEMGRKA